MSEQIDNHARDLASMLDRGQGERVTQILRNDLYSMSEQDFSKLVHATNKYEKDGCGDDLTINPYTEKGGPKEHVSVELNRRDRDGTPIVYAETIQSWGNWPGQKPQEVTPYRAPEQPADPSRARQPEPRSWDPYETPVQRSSYPDWNARNSYQDERYQSPYQDYRNQSSYRDYRYQRPNQEFQPFQSRREGLRLEEMILPALFGVGIGAALGLGRNQNHQHHSFQPQQYFYPQTYNNAPNFYQTPNFNQSHNRHHTHNHHHRRFW